MPEQPSEETPAEAEDFQPITSQEALNKLIGERIAGVKKKYADYDEIKSKAKELDKLQEASKSETQKRDERISSLEKELLGERRKTFAAEKKVPVSALSGETPEEWETAAEQLLEWRAEQEKPKSPPKPSTSLKSGATGSDSRMDPMERAAAALRGMRRQ